MRRRRPPVRPGGGEPVIGHVVRLGLGVPVIVAIVWAAQSLMNDDVERAIVVWMNPDATRPVLDTLVLLVTEYSIPGVAVAFLGWILGYTARTRGWLADDALPGVFALAGALLGAGVLALWHFESPVIGPVMAALAFLTLTVVGRSFGTMAEETQAALYRVAWMPAVAIALTDLAEPLLDELVERRYRPLDSSNRPWNEALRILPDEYVRHGNSYVSGHASGLFALLTPLAWFVRSKATRAALFTWATVHAWTRLYLAVHFPLCVVMGSFLGFAIGSLVALSERLARGPEEEASPPRRAPAARPRAGIAGA
jgi:membrane-associated phospholipid phosphatase